jgi:hypothetical protein
MMFFKMSTTLQTEHEYNEKRVKNWMFFLPIPVVVNSLFLPHLLLLSEDIFFTHTNLKTFPQPTSLTESSIGDVHLTFLFIRALKVILQVEESTAKLMYEYRSKT